MSYSNDRVAEGTGHITSDSLAAESLRGNPSQGFGANERSERGPAPSSNSSRSTTANTTDASGADQLDSAPYRQARLDETEVKGRNYRTPAQEPGLDKFADSTYSEGGGGQGYEANAGSAPAQNVGDAPRAFQPQARRTEEQLKVKGRNLQEVSSFEGEEEATNASMKYGNEVGGENDPGRQAEQAFANRTATAAGDAAYPSAGKQGPNLGHGGFENLNADENA
ncbi:MAG: hypothetical protein Q9162_003997 [Coniocarpon cinnabarinum]